MAIFASFNIRKWQSRDIDNFLETDTSGNTSYTTNGQEALQGQAYSAAVAALRLSLSLPDTHIVTLPLSFLYASRPAGPS